MKTQWTSRIFSAFLIATLAVVALPVTPAYAATIVVNTATDEDTSVGTLCSLREAIIAANNDASYNDCIAGTGSDTITFNISSASPTITFLSVPPSVQDGDGLTIDGTNLNAAGGEVTVSGNNAVRIFNITTGATTIRDITLLNGVVNGNGGAILNNGGTSLTINNVKFTTNRTVTGGGNDGGAIYHTSGTLSISNSTFTSNYTQDNGGAVYIANGTCTISGSTFNTQNNGAIDDGAAIYLNNGTLTINSTTFTSNATSNGDGGAIFQNGGTLTIGNTAAVTFTGNTASGDGGAIYVAGGTLTVNNTSFTNSTAANSADSGGAIYHNSNTLLQVTNSTFTGNTSTNGDGGAIMLDANNSSATISGSTFTSNSAEDDGGAIYIDGEPFMVSASTFSLNRAGTGAGGGADGGAIRISTNSTSATSRISLSTFTNNSITMAANNDLTGGAISNSGTIIIANVTFSGNSLTKSTGGGGDAYGGAIYAAGTTTVNNVTMSENTVSESGTGTGSGGSIYSAAGAMTIANSIVANGTENGAAGNCGGTITVGVSNIDFNGGDCGFAITTNPNLGSLTGSPQYFPLNSGSSAIDTGSNAICATATTTNNQSQNGLTRPLDGNGDTTLTCDIGSYEAPTLTATSLTVTPASGTYAGTAVLTATLSPAVSGKTINFTLNGVSAGSAVTNGSGIASIPAASLAGINAGTYPGGVGSVGSGVGASFAGDSGYGASSGTAMLTVNQAASTVTVTCTVGAPYTYTGLAQTPCTAEATGVGMTPVDVTASLIYSNNTNAGAATANASWAGDTNHTGNTGSGGFTIGQAPSAVTVTCTVGGPYTYTGLAQTPCTAEATGVGMTPVDVTASLIYSNNTNAGAATANASWAGDTNHTGNTGSGGFTIGQAASTVTVTCTVGAPYTYTGLTQTPCTAEATGVGMTPVDVTASLIYSNNTNAGAATADASWAGDSNHTGNSGSGGFTIGQTTSTVTVTCPLALQPFTGSAQIPCTAQATGVGMTPVDVTASLIYSNNVNAGAATANASWTGDTNHSGNTGSGGFTIGQATSTVTVTCPLALQPFTGSALTLCTAEATGVGMTPVDVTASLIYSNNTNAGAATANASWAGDINHSGNSGSGGFTIGQVTSTVTVTCTASAPPYTYTGSAQTPCTAEATGVGMTPVDVTASLVYSNNTNAGAATANASWAGDTNHTGNTGSGGFTIGQATSTVTVTCPLAVQPFTGSAQTPCTAQATGVGMTPVDVTASLVYSNNTNAGAATANASWAGDTNHTGNTGSSGFTIGQVTSTVTVTCPLAVQPFTGSAQTPCTAEATGVGMTPVDLTASLVYSNNINLGAATADVSWAGDTNHTGNTGSGGFTIGQATSTVTVTCPVSVPYTGSPLTPCTAQATGAGMTPVDVTASLIYSNNTNAGAATADASWAGDTNHTGNTGSGGFTIAAAGQTITVVTSAPPTASNNSTFDVEATASSGLPVTITTSGVCTGGDTDGTATITMTSGTGTCSVFYDQAGDANYAAAPQVQEDVTATEGPSFTTADNTTFDFGFAGTFTVTAIGNPSAMTITLGGTIPAGVSLTNTGTGTETLSSTAATPVGVYNLILTANNGVAPNAVQNFTLTVRNGPIIGANGVNSNPDTGDGTVSENESIIDTLGITQLTVEFSQDVNDPAGDTDPDDVTNPANYKLVRSPDGIYATVSCARGVVSPDISISVDSVTYDNGGGSGPFIATLSINGGFPLNVVGFYRLYVCGTTSIVDTINTALILAGDGLTPGTDFQRNFRISTVVTTGGGGGGGGRGGNTATSQTQVTSGFLIPVTGFAPHQTTTLPAQPADKAYKPMGEMTIEIPTLGINFPIVGASITNKTWDLTWLQNSVAYLEGSAYPTLAGNTVLTAHVLDAANNIGPFSDIKGMQVGQMVYIHANGQTYVYQVQESQKILPTSIAKIFKHEEDSWVTLVTCEDYNAKTGLYTTRRMVRAVLISVIPDKK
ncbi:MAG: sortase [Anaerolineales bacterium]|nr:sortase [Anaerolineales bacterium]